MRVDDPAIQVREGLMASSRATLMAPHAELAGCVRAYVGRSTLGAKLDASERLNHFPPSPTCAITWFMHGHYAHMRQGEAPGIQSLPWPVMFTGPHSQATCSVNPGPVECFILLMMPEAVHALTGRPIAQLVDRYLAPADVLPPDWMPLIDAVLRAPDDAARVRRIEAFLFPRWKVLSTGRPSAPGFSFWARELSSRASSDVRSERQVDRRIRTWAGLPLRQLRGIARAESTLLHAREALANKGLSWSEIAADNGFADQAHLSREIRRLTGLKPRELKELLDHESYWMYRLWK